MGREIEREGRWKEREGKEETGGQFQSMDRRVSPQSSTRLLLSSPPPSFLPSPLHELTKRRDYPTKVNVE